MIVKINQPLVKENNSFDEFNPNEISQYIEGIGVYGYEFRKLIPEINL